MTVGQVSLYLDAEANENASPDERDRALRAMQLKSIRLRLENAGRIAPANLDQMDTEQIAKLWYSVKD